MKIFDFADRGKRRARGGPLLPLLLALGLLAACAPAEQSQATESQTSAASTAPTTTATSAASTSAATTQAEAPPARRNLRGAAPAEGEKLPRPIAVMLDNHPNARYQAALSEADIVYELPVEGSFTRYMALFQSSYPEVVGPVRSAREDFLDRMLEFDAFFVHFGASRPAEERMAAEGYERADGMAGWDFFWRKNDTGKFAPHNAYVDLKLLAASESLPVRDWDESRPLYEFNAAATAPGGSPAQSVAIAINPDNSTEYRYLSDKQLYQRSKDGDTDLDENTQAPIEVANVIIQLADYYVYENSWQRIEDSGEGEGYYVSMGEVIPIRWVKERTDALTRFYRQDGSELKLNPGQTWVEVVGLEVKPRFE